ncbi:Cellulase [Methylobacterium sp. 4-46]|uniref:cellulase family glycosylhydrolase n=1 Tax=unclassified Methylobacterium TaxID=2615210 RepID=UPI000152CFAA|nr:MULTISPECIES: cellulase family glycosylhydrolase [Methylobacterium]ACA17809.1 Cellulase [Methylobacterium sp. 4-46]WFT77116.1 cellulase family glycosylhydrolase [Methylobacterium nodulans]
MALKSSNPATQIAAPPAPWLDASTDSGALGDNLTSFRSLKLDGTGAPGTAILVSYTGTTAAGKRVSGTMPAVTVDASGAWSVATTSLSDGVYAFTAVAQSGPRSTSAPSPALTVTIDTTPPPAPILRDFPAASTNNATPTLAGTAEKGAKVAIYMDGAATAQAIVTADATGAWSYTEASRLIDGTHSFVATATDAAGNTSVRSSAKSVIIDTVAPTETITQLLVAGDNVIDAGEQAAGTVTVSGTLSAALAPAESLLLTVAGATYTVPQASLSGTSFSLQVAKPAAGWASGSASARVQDAAGNAGQTTTQSFTLGGAPVPPAGQLSLLGINLAGGEFGSAVPGRYGTDYIYPNHAEIDYYAGKGLNVIRLPFLWERLQPVQGGALSSSDLAYIDDVVSYANAKGMKVVLDMHNYGSGYGSPVGSAATPVGAFADFWGRMAGHFASNPNVLFGLMNEPQQSTATEWLGDVNAAIQAIRGAGATAQEILVPGTYWDGAWTWTTSDNAAVLGGGVVDPSNNYAFEVHQYLDGDGSGTHAGVASTSIGVERLQAATQWAESTHNRLFLGEFGVAQDQTSLAAMDAMLGYMSQHTGAWQGATYWAGGPWWGDYMFSAEPTGLGTSSVTDKPQMTVLDKYI